MLRFCTRRFHHRQCIILLPQFPESGQIRVGVTSSDNVMNRVYGSRVILPVDPLIRSFRGIILPPRTRIGVLSNGAETVYHPFPLYAE